VRATTKLSRPHHHSDMTAVLCNLRQNTNDEKDRTNCRESFRSAREPESGPSDEAANSLLELFPGQRKSTLSRSMRAVGRSLQTRDGAGPAKFRIGRSRSRSGRRSSARVRDQDRVLDCGHDSRGLLSARFRSRPPASAAFASVHGVDPKFVDASARLDLSGEPPRAKSAPRPGLRRIIRIAELWSGPRVGPA
jgi:hypothetical protein